MCLKYNYRLCHRHKTNNNLKKRKTKIKAPVLPTQELLPRYLHKLAYDIIPP